MYNFRYEVMLCAKISHSKMGYQQQNPNVRTFAVDGYAADIPVLPAIAAAYRRFDGKVRLTLPLQDTPYKK